MYISIYKICTYIFYKDIRYYILYTYIYYICNIYVIYILYYILYIYM